MIPKLRTGAALAALMAGMSIIAAAAATPPPTPNAAGAPFKMLSYSDTFTLAANGTYTRTVHKIIEPLTKNGVQSNGQIQELVATAMEHFHLVSAKTIAPNGKIYPVTAKDVHTQTAPSAVDAPSFSDAKIVSIEFPHVERGSKLDVTYTIHRFQAYFPNEFSGIDAVPPGQLTGHEQVEVRAPASLHLLTSVRGGYTMTRTVKGNTQIITATLDNPPYHVVPGDAVSTAQFEPMFLATTFPNWQALGDAYWSRAAAKTQATPDVKKLADEITGNKTGRAAMDALYDWAATHIRWVGIEPGLSGWIPAAAGHTLTRRYGDCKASETLLVALLKAKGIKAEPALIDGGSAVYRLTRRVNLGIIDHVIVYVPKYKLFLDPTSGFATPGELPVGDADKPVILASAHSSLARTPAGPASYIQQTAETIAPNGALHGSGTIHATGYTDWMMRDILDQLPKAAYPRVVKQVLSGEGLVGTGTFTAASADDLTKPFIVTDHWRAPGYYDPGHIVVLRVHKGFAFTAIGHYLATNASPSQLYPVKRAIGTLHFTTSLTLPAGYKVLATPESGTVKTSVGSFVQSATMHGTTLRLVQTLSLDRMWYPVQDRDALKTLFTKAYRLDRQQIVLERTNTKPQA
ncbi:MAG: hypothetical protein B7Z58_13765 [Acidiphilium sp. 37-64-53]|uniref:DUF3857 domain-containing transglutaminase family protein n=1 Tax=Acidiphilium TaxID=522 RepID=UPI000BD2DF0F|nr:MULTISPECIES: DUF3857 domain-containing transglutaminase family protein [Acidiphilium]OYW00886.1 MAG: hypothetical protein B7Z58_13765 [Acidiphilium sp. 37-64-53]OZB27454.1 MAG: hypothetical protein B7X49_10975 [Acidiphilium sp. 34-64-41]HQT86314.1 DUF3857 domain-containing transglutaminase family protein [Acidiphilium rubrum]